MIWELLAANSLSLSLWGIKKHLQVTHANAVHCFPSLPLMSHKNGSLWELHSTSVCRRCMSMCISLVARKYMNMLHLEFSIDVPDTNV